MSGNDPLPDLTRWNRAGLQRFRYVDGNAVSHLETLRAALALAFPQWPALKDGGPATDSARRARMIERYRGPRQDIGWEIARSFARAAHIVTEHIDAFANEGFIGTATQWEYLKRLVEPLDYRPLPPGSAQTTVALIVKGDPGIVEAGFQLQHLPDAGAPLIFETLADLVVDAALNGLRIAGWNRNPNSFEPAPAPGGAAAGSPWRLPEKHGLTAGQPCVLVQGNRTAALLVAAIDGETLHADGDKATLGGAPWILGDTRLLAKPDKVWKPRLNGGATSAFKSTDRLVVGQTVFWKNSTQSGFARIAAVDRGVARLTDIRPAGTAIAPETAFYSVQDMTAEQFKANGNEWRFALGAVDGGGQTTLRMLGADAEGVLDAAELKPTLVKARLPNAGSDSYSKLTNFAGVHLKVYDSAASEPLATTVAARSDARITVPGGAGKLRSGDYIVAEDTGRAREVLKIETIVEREDEFDLTFDAPLQGLDEIARFSGPFTLELRPEGWDRNPLPVSSAAFAIDGDGALPELLTGGKTVLVEPDTAKPGLAAFRTELIEVRRDERRLVLAAPVSVFAGYSIADVVIRANAVVVGHGEAMPPVVLGSGDASATNQEFLIDKADLAFTADDTLAAGGRAAVTVVVEGRTYEEVSTLADSESSDAHYETRLTEDGLVRVVFGDGFHGRRLPTGRNNIRATYRVGNGLRGNNIPPGGLAKPVRPHIRVDSVRQPLPSWGGQDREDAGGIRANAPAYLAALGRGVALADFAQLARSQPGIWAARALQIVEPAGRSDRIDIIVVPAGDAPLGELGDTIEARLLALSPPGLQFRVRRFDPVPLQLSIRIRVDARQFDGDKVEADTRAALFAALTLQRRAPGQPLSRSEVYAVVEAINGVANSDAVLFPGLADPLLSESGQPLEPSLRGPGDQIWTVRPTAWQVVYLRHPSAIQILREDAVA